MKALRLLFCLVCIGLMAFPGSARAWDHKDKFDVRYAAFAGGLHALDIDIAMNYNTAHYDASMHAKPYGMIGKMLPWAGDYTSRGAMHLNKSGLTLTPELHDKISAWRDDQDHLRITYKNGVIKTLQQIDVKNGKTNSYDKALQKGFHENTVDMVTSIMTMLGQATEKDNCTFSQDVFDGKRRFRITFKDQGVVTIAKSSLNMFEGKARQCQLELIPLMGFKDKKPRGFYKIQEEARARGDLPKVWLGRLWKDGPMVPVRMLIKSEYGAVFVHLQNLKR